MPRIAMIGAGSVVFAKQLMMDILSTPELSDATIALMDIQPIRVKTAVAMVEAVAKATGAKAKVEGYLDRREALKGADYVINAIQVGGHEATLLDFEIPKKYGLKQTIADTLGVGGVFRSLRTIPVLMEICRDMEAVCPDAVLLNYTNPMAMLMSSVFKAFPGMQAVGLCHSVQGTSKRLARFIGADFADVTYKCAGINHMAFFLEYKVKGQDAYPRLWEALKNPEIFAQDRVRFEVMRRLGYFITESSEHLSEYVPWFIKRESEIERFQIPIDEYVRRSERNLGTFDATRKALEAGEPIQVKQSHEYAAYIIKAMETNQDWSFHGNVNNNGLIGNLPADCCVEVPILVNGAGLQPVKIGNLPVECAAMNRTNINVQQLTVEAALTGNRDNVYHAVMLDPHTAAVLTLDEIFRMTDELIEAHGSALPVLKPTRLF